MDPRRVIRSYLVISGLFTLSASLIWGINTLFLLHAGLSIFEVFVANAAFTAAMALCEVPTGVVADTLGRRTSFLLSEATLVVGTLAYVGVAAIHGGLALFCLAGVILGLGYTFYSGAVEAWLVDALEATGYREELDPVFARASIVSSVAMIVGTIGGGLLGQVNLSLPYVIRAALVAMAFVIGFRTMHDIGFTHRPMRLRGIVGDMRKVGRAGITYGWRSPAVRLLVIESFVVTGFFSWAWYAWQPYFLDLYGRNAIWIAGVIASLFSLAGIAGNALVGRLARPSRRRTTILLGAGAVWCTTMVATGVIQSFWITVPIFLLGAMAGGLISPVRQTYLHQSIPSSERATLVSFDSLVGSVGSVGGQTGLGFLSQERSLPTGFVVGGLTTLLVLPIFGRLRALDEPADRITAAEAAEAATAPPAFAGAAAAPAEEPVR
ncbi:MAG TPA: MFS transporter [Actinomycetota bacterium]|nr:MFS transporter [Actinomycetota bacterium]